MKSKSDASAWLSLKQKLVLPLFVLLMVPVFFVAKNIFTSYAQTRNSKEKIIKKVSFDNEPLQFLAFESDGKKINSDEKFTRDNDWLNDFTIRFRNVSGKPIVYVSIALGFPETATTEPPIGYFLKYGVNPLVPTQKIENDKREILAPNEIAEVKLSPEKFDGLKTFLGSRRQLSELTIVDYRIMVVYFEDGSAWSAGNDLQPDPSRPGKFIHAKKKGQEEEK
ncbi:MAG TPA: hypothetical protein VGJ02_02370 [Pyrinomonadaceae bacterium]|jgi:hypothetical protein